jgi:hypothetical protein
MRYTTRREADVDTAYGNPVGAYGFLEFARSSGRQQAKKT